MLRQADVGREVDQLKRVDDRGRRGGRPRLALERETCVHVWVVRADVDSATGRGDEPEVGRIMRLKAENAPLHADVEVLAAAPSSDDHW